MYLSIVLLLIFLLSSCDLDSNNDEETRDLNQSISFSELVDKRMMEDDSINGQLVLITSEVNAYFNQDEGCAINPMPAPICTDELYSTEVSEPIYQRGSGIGACKGYGFELTDLVVSEKLNIDLDENPEFFSLNEEYNVPVNFYAKVEYVERPVFCSDQVNYGLTLTLKEGEEAHLLAQF